MSARAADTTDAGTRRYELHDGRTLTVVANGAMANLAAGNGNPIETMDMGLTLQLRCLAHLAVRADELPHGLQAVPESIDQQAAEAMTRHLSPARIPPQ